MGANHSELVVRDPGLVGDPLRAIAPVTPLLMPLSLWLIFPYLALTEWRWDVVARPAPRLSMCDERSKSLVEPWIWVCSAFVEEL